MPDTTTQLQRRSPLLPSKHDFIIDYAQVRLQERKALSVIQVLTFHDKHLDAATAIGNALALDCPTRAGLTCTDGNTRISWNGPNSWLIIAGDGQIDHQTDALVERLQKAVGNLGAVVDQSHGRCCLRLSGPKARQVMAKNTAIDLHPRAFGPGKCALSAVAHVNVSIIQIDEVPTYDLYVNRSLARSCAQVLQQSCHEFANH